MDKKLKGKMSRITTWLIGIAIAIIAINMSIFRLEVKASETGIGYPYEKCEWSVVKENEDGLVYKYGTGVNSGDSYLLLYNYLSQYRDELVDICNNSERLHVETFVYSIPSDLFSHCTNLLTVEMNLVNSISAYAFEGCSSLYEVSLGTSMSTIGESAFKDCTSLEKIEFSAYVYVIGQSAFEGCTKLSIIDFTNYTSRVHGANNLFGYRAFANCGTNNAFGGEVKVLLDKDGGEIVKDNLDNPYWDKEYMFGDRPFTNTTYSLQYIERDNSNVIEEDYEENVHYIVTKEDGSGYTVEIESYSSRPYGTISDYSVKNGLTTAPWAKYCTENSKVVIKDGVTTIGKNAFYGCTGIQYVELPNTIGKIQTAAFSGCVNADINLDVLEYANTISDHAFYNCRNITKIGPLRMVKSLGGYAFYNCSNMAGDIDLYRVKEFGYSGYEGLGHVFYNCPKITGNVVLSKVSEISDYSFYGCSGLSGVSFTNDDKELVIGNYAFYNCTGLGGDLDLSHVSKVKDYAFYGCSSLDGQLIFSEEEPKTEIYDYAFSGCRNLNGEISSDIYICNQNAQSTAFIDCDKLLVGDFSYEDFASDSKTKVSYQSLALNGSIGVNFYVSMPDNLAKINSAYILINEIKYPLNKAIKTESGYKFEYFVNAKEMKDDIAVSLFYDNDKKLNLMNETATDGILHCSVKSYIEQAKQSSDEKMVALANAMDLYGMWSQKYFEYNIESLGSLINPKEADISKYVFNETGTLPEGLKYYGSSLVLKSETTIRHYFVVVGHEASEFEFTVEGKKVTPVERGGMIYIEIPNIAAPNLGFDYIVRVNGDYAIKYSALTYMNKAKEKENVALNNLANAMYGYFIASKNYFNSAVDDDEMDIM